MDKTGADRLQAQLSGQLSLSAWGGCRKKSPAVLLGSVVLFGASLLMASVPASRSGEPKPSRPYAHEEASLPMVALLEEMKRGRAGVALVSYRETGLLAGPVAKSFLFEGPAADRDRAISCLATAAWYEAGNDVSGQRAVMQVVLNRLRHPSFPKSVCGVVFQGSERKTGCQFSFTCDGSMSRRFPQPKAWTQTRMLAENALNGAVDPDVGQATHFHTDYVTPWWSPMLERISKIGAHVFYRWGGVQGALRSDKVTTFRENWPQVTSAGSVPAQGVTGTLPAVHMPVNAAIVTGPVPNDGIGQVVGLAITAKPVDAAPNRAMLMQVDTSVPSGRWAMEAMALCADERTCQVIAYGQADQVKRNRQFRGSAMERPLFLFVRDASGMEIAVWDCDRAPRARPEQCLPHGSELNALLERR